MTNTQAHSSRRKVRLFFAWEDGKEAEWLQRMGNEGWRFVRYQFLVYTFVRAKPLNEVYQLDFYYETKDGYEEYLQLFQDAGWELAHKFSGWHYFRRPYEPGKPMKIYTDKEGQVRKYKKVLIFLGIAGFPSMYLAVMWPSYYSGILEASNFLTGIRALVSTVALLIAATIARVYFRVRQLKRQSDHDAG